MFLADVDASQFEGGEHPADGVTADAVGATLPVLDGVRVNAGGECELLLRHAGQNPRGLQ